MSQREFGALTAATLLFRAQRANAGAPDVFVFGHDLPANIDPDQILDLGMTGYGIANRVQGFRHCPVGSGGEVRWMRLSA